MSLADGKICHPTVAVYPLPTKLFANRKKDRAQSALVPWYGAADDAKGTPAAGTVAAGK